MSSEFSGRSERTKPVCKFGKHKIQAVGAASDQEHKCFALSLMQRLEHDTQSTGRHFVRSKIGKKNCDGI